LKDVICNGGKIFDAVFRNVDLLRIKNPITLKIVRDVITKVYYSLKAGNNKTLLGARAEKFGLTCLLCDRQYKLLSDHVGQSHGHHPRSSSDVATTFAFQQDIDESLQDILLVPVGKRKQLRTCKYCPQSFICRCRLDAHVLEYHYRHHGLEYLDKLNKESLCPHCLQVLPSKCQLLKHVYCDHPPWSQAAMVALKERNHFYEWGLSQDKYSNNLRLLHHV